MSVTDETLGLAQTLRLELDATIDARTRELARAWSSAWEELADEWQAAIADLLTGDEWPTRAQVVRAERARKALAATRQAFDDLARQIGVTVTSDMPAMAEAIAAWQQRLVASELPSGAVFDWTRMDAKALEAIVKRTTKQIEAASRRLPREQAAVMKQALIRGVAVGDNPRTAAKLMLDRLGGVFDGGRRRAETIARTEMLDASRRAAQAARIANKGIITGWRWHATMSDRTCPVCLVMDGTVFPPEAFGPEDHPNGRCVGVPLTVSWRDLGFDIDEPADVTPDAHDWYERQPTSVQNNIMGADRAQRLRSGDLGWSDLVVRRDNPDWRPSYHLVPLKAA